MFFWAAFSTTKATFTLFESTICLLRRFLSCPGCWRSWIWNERKRKPITSRRWWFWWYGSKIYPFCLYAYWVVWHTCIRVWVEKLHELLSCEEVQNALPLGKLWREFLSVKNIVSQASLAPSACHYQLFSIAFFRQFMFSNVMFPRHLMSIRWPG